MVAGVSYLGSTPIAPEEMPQTLGSSWIRLCLDKNKSKRRRRAGSLDERFGDPSISGPVEGGWNQVSSTATEDEKENRTQPSREPSLKLLAGSSVGRHLNSRKWKYGPNKPKGEKCPPSSAQCSKYTKPDETPPVISSSDKPDFVYKPASEGFLRSMADIGKPKQTHSSPNSPPSTMGSEDLKRQESMNSNNSLEPTLPSDIPYHPSYQNIAHRQPSPNPGMPNQGRVSTSPSDQFQDRRRYAASPSPSRRNSFTIDDERTPGTSITDPEKSPQVDTFETVCNVPVYMPTNPPPKPNLNLTKQKHKPKRSVTSEMVPSTKELFG